MGFRTRLLKACIRLAFRLMADRSPDARAFPEKNRILILRWDAIPGAIQTAISQSLPALTGCNGSISVDRDRQQSTDSVEKVDPGWRSMH